MTETRKAAAEALCRMTIYDLVLPPGGTELAGGPTRFLYAAIGSFDIRSEESIATASTDEGLFASGTVRIEGEGTLWVFEVASPEHALRRPLATLVLSRLVRVGFSRPWLLRADRVESSPGSATPRHGHQGPGMRRLVRGQILAEVGDEVGRIQKGQAWFETGRDWVVGTNVHTGNSVFVRVMVLPSELQGGKSSFIPANAEEAAKPRAVTYRLFGETMLERESGVLVAS